MNEFAEPKCVPEKFEQRVSEILQLLELSKDSGFAAVSNAYMLEWLNSGLAAHGHINTILWSLVDNGHVYAFTCVLGGSRATVWSLDDNPPTCESEVL